MTEFYNLRVSEGGSDFEEGYQLRFILVALDNNVALFFLSRHTWQCFIHVPRGGGKSSCVYRSRSHSHQQATDTVNR